MTSRPISVSHLVFGLVYLGAAAMWAVGAATDADVPNMAVIAPSILILAGAVGLVALVFNERNARSRSEAATPIEPAYVAGDHPDALNGVDNPQEKL